MNLLSQRAKRADTALQVVYLFLIFLWVSKVECREDKEWLASIMFTRRTDGVTSSRGKPIVGFVGCSWRRGDSPHIYDNIASGLTSLVLVVAVDETPDFA